jgi:hypothetical protein
MLEIRSRGLVSRRLNRLGTGTEIAIEATSYLVPVLILIAIGVYLYLKRRNATAMFEQATASVSTARPTRKEA